MERPSPVTGGRGFESERGNAAHRLVRLADVEDAGLTGEGHEGLQNEGDAARERGQGGFEGRAGLDEAHAGAVAAYVGFDDEGQSKARGGDGLLGAGEIAGAGVDHRVRGDPVAGGALGEIEDGGFTLAAEAAGGDAGVRGGGQAEIAVPEAERDPLGDDWAVGDPAGQEFQAGDGGRLGRVGRKARDIEGQVAHGRGLMMAWRRGRPCGRRE